MKTFALAIALALTAAEGHAQRLDESRVAFAPTRQALVSPEERDGQMASRLLLGLLGGFAFGVPVALVTVIPLIGNCEGECDGDGSAVVITAAAYFTGVAAGAALPSARKCAGGQRFGRAMIGAMLGGALAFGALNLAGNYEGPAAAAPVAVGVFAAPTVAALSLRRCD